MAFNGRYNEYRHVMTKALEDKEKNNLTACVDGLTAALDASIKCLKHHRIQKQK